MWQKGYKMPWRGRSSDGAREKNHQAHKLDHLALAASQGSRTMYFYTEYNSWSSEVQGNITHPLALPGSEQEERACSPVSSLPFVHLKLTQLVSHPMYMESSHSKFLFGPTFTSMFWQELQFEINRWKCYDESVSRWFRPGQGVRSLTILLWDF